jgi:hypothetical protein
LIGPGAKRPNWLDDPAAGWGWFIDPTPRDDSEFTTPGDLGEQNRMDLLTVLLHEIGHLLGQEHQADGLMAETLTAGTRLLPAREMYPADLTAALFAIDLPADAVPCIDPAHPWGRRKKSHFFLVPGWAGLVR